MTNDYFPLGTVVLLKGGEKPMMVSGYLAKAQDTPGVIRDYFGYPYPEGCVDSTIVYQFDQENVEGILFMGYQDTETHAYLKALSEQAEDLKKKALETV